MSFTKKVVSTYAKSLFQNVNTLNSANESFKISTITSKNSINSKPNVYIVGEELMLIKAVLVTSKKNESIF